MKKTLVSIAAASLLALNFTGCGSSSSSTSSETKEVKVADIASVVSAEVTSGALTATELGNGFYNFSAQPTEKMLSTGGFIDYNNNNTQDTGEPTALTLSADADKSTLNAFTTLVTESSKSEQEIADLLGLTIDELNSDTSLASLEVQKKVVLANAIVKQVQGTSSTTTTATTEVTAPVSSTDTTSSEATSTENTSTTDDAPSSVLPSIDGSSTAAVATTTETVATETAETETAATETAATETAATETADILPSIGRSLRADGEDSTTPPVLPTVGTATTTATNDTSGVLPSTETNKYDELLDQISSKINTGESIYSAVVNTTGISELSNLESATDSESVQAINTTLLTETVTDTILPPVSTPVTSPIDNETVVPVPTPTPTSPVPTPTEPVVTPTPTAPVPTPTPDNGVIDPEETLETANEGDISSEQNIGTSDEQISVGF